MCVCVCVFFSNKDPYRGSDIINAKGTEILNHNFSLIGQVDPAYFIIK